ncbi:hypothetical protein CSUI_005125 [Cystoisospora suis]|uniref:Uncharacterized protein n=1 Tax=Cystoisospora suis TaxID=483139 RepID=A0A2C6K810_9APIC|nr:hypothetical protein CSUI_005125 [Cystoisospora suis]
MLARLRLGRAGVHTDSVKSRLQENIHRNHRISEADTSSTSQSDSVERGTIFFLLRFNHELQREQRLMRTLPGSSVSTTSVAQSGPTEEPVLPEDAPAPTQVREWDRCSALPVAAAE